MFSIILPIFNPVAINLGVIQIRWYALAYILGLIIGIFYLYKLESDINFFPNKKSKKSFFEDYISVIALAIILGGRLGYVLFYNMSYYLNNPIKILYLWEGGMSFHGALIACIIAIVIFAKYKNFNFLTLGDLTTVATPIGIFLGRIANFINQELPGRITNVPWGVVFNNDIVTRHPSEIYEALLEGFVLFFILLFAWKKLKLYKKHGVISSLFLIFYGLFRSIIEFVREPDPQIGYVLSYFTLGQILSIIMLISGIILYFYINTSYNAKKHPSQPFRKYNKKIN